MGRLVGLVLLLFAPVVARAQDDPLQLEAGRTAWLEGEASAGLPLRVTCDLPAGGYLLVETEGVGPFAEVDVSVERGAGRWRSSSHGARERLLVPVAGRDALVQVALGDEGSAGAGVARFRLGLTALATPPALLEAPTVLEGPAVLEAPARPESHGVGGLLRGAERTRLVRLRPGAAGRYRLRVARPAGAGDPDVLVVEPSGALRAIGETRGGEDLALSVAGGEELLACVRLAGDEEAAFALSLVADERPSLAPIEAFLAALAQTAAQREALTALRRNLDFMRIEAYLEHYPGGVPLQLHVVPGLRAHGVERFGTYSQGSLTINPTIEGHRTNVQELVDTLVHELVHALLSYPRADAFPLAPDVLDSSHDPGLRGLGNRPLRRGQVTEPFSSYLEAHYGPSASNPAEDYSDVNAGAQRLIMKVVRDCLARTGLGRETLVFENARRRAESAARATTTK